MENNQKSIVHTILLVTIVSMFVVGMGYFAYKIGAIEIINPKRKLPPEKYTNSINTSPTSSVVNTSNWKTYINDKYKFSFEYPKQMELRSMPIGKNSNTDPSSSSYIILGNEIYFIVSEVVDSPAPERGYEKILTIDGNTFYEKPYPNGDGPDLTPFTRLEIDNSNVGVTIDIRGNYPINTLQNQILSTFKFIEMDSRVLFKITDNDSKNIYMVLPIGATINGDKLNIEGDVYDIEIHVGPGLCSEDEFGDTCTYVDESTNKWPTLRIWTIDGYVMALNPQGAGIDNVYTDGIIITSSTTKFTKEVINKWKIWLDNLIVK